MRPVFSAEFAPGPVSRKPLLRQVTGFVEEVRQYRRLAEKKECRYFADSSEEEQLEGLET